MFNHLTPVDPHKRQRVSRPLLAPGLGIESRPGEIIFETPARALPEQQADAAHVAPLSILSNYRSLIACAQDL